MALGSDGVVDYLETPDGVRYMLGDVSLLKVVAELVPGSGPKRQAMDQLEQHRRAMVTLSLDKFFALTAPVRRRFGSTDVAGDTGITFPLMARQNRNQGPSMYDLNVLHTNLNTVEARMASLRTATQTPETLGQLRHMIANISLPNFGDQSKNDAFNGLGAPVVDTVPPGGYNAPPAVTNPKMAQEVALIEANGQVAQSLFGQLNEVADKVTQLVAAAQRGEKKAFRHDLARRDISALTGSVLDVVKGGLGSTQATASLRDLAGKVASLHGLFFPKKLGWRGAYESTFDNGSCGTHRYGWAARGRQCGAGLQVL